MGKKQPEWEIHIIPRSTGRHRIFRLTELKRRALLIGASLVTFIAFAAIVITVLLSFGITLGMDQFNFVELKRLRVENEELRGELTLIVDLEREVTLGEEIVSRLRGMLGIDLAEERRAEAERILTSAVPYVPGEEPEALELTGEAATYAPTGPAAGRTSELAAYVARAAVQGLSTPRGWPLRGWITRGFVPAGDSKHAGIDIACDEGRPVSATAAGVVVFASEDRHYGLKVVISHDSGYTTTYGHNSKLLVQVGDTVERGQHIALSGNTGASTSPHLHYEIRRDDIPIDPTPFLEE
ncbi:MAG TPA: M23 family metallopeptidase [bacterium]|nr:M23 family metallopeptidase [bacterium]